MNAIKYRLAYTSVLHDRGNGKSHRTVFIFEYVQGPTNKCTQDLLFSKP